MEPSPPKTDLAELLERAAQRGAALAIEKLASGLGVGQMPIDDDALLTEDQAAGFLAMKPSTLAAWRCRGGGPAFIRMGSSKRPANRYRLGDPRAWAGERRHANTAHKIGTDDGSGS